MLANNIDISGFGATLLNLDIQKSDITINQEWLKKAHSPTLLDQKFYFKKILMEISIEGISRQDVITKMSNLIDLLKNCTLKFDDLDFYYDAVLYNSNHNKMIKLNKLKLFCEFNSGHAYNQSIIETLNHVSSKTINIPGNLPSPAIVTVTAPIDTISLTINGFGDSITVKNLKANIPVIIDGEACTVTQAGLNKFGETDMWEFPVLQPGSNTITSSTANCVINISYKPKYL